MSSRSYALLARAHWPDRERAIRELLARHWSHAASSAMRIVDVGCGPGWLASTARDLGFGYLGIDPFPPDQVVHGTATRGTAADAARLLGPDDVAILNGTAHHLPDAEFKELLDACRATRGLVICDHSLDGSTPVWARAMQRLDRGRFVRARCVYEAIPGLGELESRRFPIRLLGVPVWDYFATAYSPTP